MLRNVTQGLVLEDDSGGAFGTYVCTREINTRIRWGNMQERDPLKDINVDGKIILKLILKCWIGEGGRTLFCS
jgi:hypothetical protein